MQAIFIPAFINDVEEIVPTILPLPHRHPEEYLVRVTHCSPQHADILHANGKHQNTHPQRGHVHPPFILGYNFSGVIEEAEKEDLPFKKGDRVFGSKIGAFADYVAVRHHNIRKIPEGVSSEHACALSGQLVSYAAVKMVAGVKRGDVVLVSGASGGVGSGCCAVAKALGARVIALTESKEKVERMRKELEVDEVVLMKDGWVREVQKLTEARGVDFVFDNTGMVNDAVRCLVHEGKIIILGFASRAGVMEEVKTNRLLLKSASLIGFRFGEYSRHNPERLKEINEGFEKMLCEGKLKPPLHGTYLGFESMKQAFIDLHERRVLGKIVVDVQQDKLPLRPKL